MTCYACEKAQDRPNLKFRGPPGCIGCDARQLALTYGGMNHEAITTAMHRQWPTTAEFKQGRNLFWIWVKRLNEAKG